METTELLDQLQADRSAVDRKIEELNQELKSLISAKAELEVALRGIESGLRLAGQRLSKEPDAVPIRPTPAAQGPDWKNMARTAAIVRVLEESDVPLSPLQISERLGAHGRSVDRPEIVGRTLDYLRRGDKVLNVGRAQWVPFGRQGPQSMERAEM